MRLHLGKRKIQREISTLEFSIVSIVASMHLGAEIDLENVEELLRVANYSGQPHFLAFRFSGLSVAILVYKGGTILFAGAKDSSELENAKETLLSKLRQIGIISSSTIQLKIRNIVAVADAGMELDIEDFARRATIEKVEYNPEIFPGLIYRHRESRKVALIFHTGKIVITGAKSVSDIKNMLMQLRRILCLM